MTRTRRIHDAVHPRKVLTDLHLLPMQRLNQEDAMQRILGLIVTILLFGMIVSTPVHAENAKLARGAGTLPQGTWATSFGAGADTPNVFGYVVGVDYGISDRFQLGVAGNYGVVWATGSLSSAVNFFQSTDGSHLLGFRVAPSYLWFNVGFAKGKLFVFDPTLAYEYRWGDEHHTGVYVQAGTAHYYANLGSDVVSSLFKTTDANAKLWAHAVRGSVGIQHQFGNRFAMAAEGGAGYGFRTKKVLPSGHLTFSWAF